MNYILEDALNKLFVAYRKSCKNNEHLIKEEMDKEEIDISVNYFEDEESFEEYILNQDMESTLSDFDLAVLDDMKKYLSDIADEDYKEFCDLASLLTLEYYNIVKRDMSKFEDYIDDEN